MILVLVLAILALIAVGVYAVIDTLAGPDLDLLETWCPQCGARGGRHVHPGWTERGPR